MAEQLTAIIPCKNEQANIRPCIESLRGLADEILVADSGSTDKTLEIVRNLGGCRVISREYINSGDFKNWAIPQASHPWVLLVDADERVTPALANEIRAQLERGPEQDGYRIFRDNHFLGHPVRHGSWASDNVLRFFRRDCGRYSGPSDHGRIRISTQRVGTLREHLLHYTYWSYDQMFRKFQRYAKLQAGEWYVQGRRPSVVQLLFRAPLRFVRDYVLKRGFLDGTVGIQVAATSSIYCFLKQAHLWELHYGRTQSDPEGTVTLSRIAAGAQSGRSTRSIALSATLDVIAKPVTAGDADSQPASRNSPYPVGRETDP